MKSQRKILLFFTIIYFLFTLQGNAWWDHTHMLLTRYGALNSQLEQGDLMLRLNLDKGLDHEMLRFPLPSWFVVGHSQSVMGWMRYGAIREDSTDTTFFNLVPVHRRYDNHFHAPLRVWSVAGLDDWAFVVVPVDGDSSILWSQNRGENDQTNYPDGDNSWQQVRRYYYDALTTPTDANDSNWPRTWNFINTFKGLGHQMHLLEDMAVPEHVRNDAHPEKTQNGFRVFENWANDNSHEGLWMDIFAQSPVFPTIDLNDQFYSEDYVQTTKLWDSVHYLYGVVPTTSTEWGLSEYTNSNFFSEDTVFSAPEDNLLAPSRHQFPYPRISSTNLNELLNDNLPPLDTTAEDGQTDRRFYVSKVTHGETVNRFLTSIYLERELRALSSINLPVYRELYRESFFRDNRCHRDYAERLVPRAVGYAATLVDYFFRGRIEIALPFSDNPSAPSAEAKDDGVYAFTDDPAQGFQEITLMARNVTPDEEMANGEVKLLIRYRICPGDPFAPNPPAPTIDHPQFQIVDPLPDPNTGQPITSIPSDQWIKLKFDISSQPIPMNAMDLNFTLIFRGDLGFETETGVAIGFKDVSEPSPLTIFNNSDLVCYNGTYVDWNDPGLFDLADANDDGAIDCTGGDLDITPNRILLHHVSFNGVRASDTNFNHQFSPDHELLPGESLQLYVIGDEPPEPCLISIETTAISTIAPNTCITWYPGGVAAMGLVVNKFEWDSDELPGDFYTHWISSFANFRGTYYHYLYHYENISVPDGSHCPIDQLIIPESREDAKKKSLLLDGNPIKQATRRHPNVHGVWKEQRETNR